MALEAQWMQNRTFSAREDRALIASLYDEGVLDLTMFEVTPDSPTAMTVEIANGICVIDGDTQTAQNSYCVQSTVVETSDLVTPPAVNPRIDLLVVQVRDPDAGGVAGDDVQIAWVQGTEASSPVAPTVPDTTLVLAEVALSVGQVSIEAGDITDRRVIAGRKSQPGVMELYTGDVDQVPSGWLQCNGQEVNRSDYPALHALYAAQGYPYGDGNGTSTFNVPDMQDRVPVASGSTKDAGESGGQVSLVLSNGQLPTHTHTHTHTHTIGHTHTLLHTHGMSHTHGAGSFTATADGSEHEHRYMGRRSSLSTAGPFDPTWTALSVEASQVVLPSQYHVYAGLSSAETHSHSISGTSSGSSISSTGGASNSTTSGASTGSSGNSSTTSTSPAGSSNPVNVEQPFLVLPMWLVRT